MNRETGETATGASIITLPPPPEWQSIHSKSMPLLLPIEDIATLDAWLDPQVQDVAQFEWLLQSQIRVDQVLTPINKPSQWDETGEPFRIKASAK